MNARELSYKARSNTPVQERNRHSENPKNLANPDSDILSTIAFPLESAGFSIQKKGLTRGINPFTVSTHDHHLDYPRL